VLGGAGKVPAETWGIISKGSAGRTPKKKRSKRVPGCTIMGLWGKSKKKKKKKKKKQPGNTGKKRHIKQDTRDLGPPSHPKRNETKAGHNAKRGGRGEGQLSAGGRLKRRKRLGDGDIPRGTAIRGRRRLGGVDQFQPESILRPDRLNGYWHR